MIRVIELKKYFDDVHAVDGISFSIKKGEILGLLGPNGAGKTTTMRVITGYIRPTSGKVLINEINPETDPLIAKSKIGYLPENSPSYPEMNVFEYLNFFAKLRGLKGSKLKNEIDEKVELCGLGKMLYRDIGTLSKGYKQRTGLARVLLGDPEILILDEPSSGLDPNQIVEIRELIKKIGKARTVILSSHILSEIALSCDTILIINNGKAAAYGPMTEIIEQNTISEKISVVLKGDSESINKMFDSMEIILSYDLLEEHDNNKRFILKVKKDSLAGESIFKEAFSRGLVISELKKETSDLEQSFIKYTKGENK